MFAELGLKPRPPTRCPELLLPNQFSVHHKNHSQDGALTVLCCLLRICLAQAGTILFFFALNDLKESVPPES